MMIRARIGSPYIVVIYDYSANLKPVFYNMGLLWCEFRTALLRFVIIMVNIAMMQRGLVKAESRAIMLQYVMLQQGNSTVRI